MASIMIVICGPKFIDSVALIIMIIVLVKINYTCLSQNSSSGHKLT